MTQSDLGQRSGCAKARISRYENGHTEPTIGTLRRLADALGVSEHWLLTGEVAPKEDFIGVLVARGVVFRTRRDVQTLSDMSVEAARALGMIDDPIRSVVRGVQPLAPS
jgi:transcriptional regulator with XRE-family HTH domain